MTSTTMPQYKERRAVHVYRMSDRLQVIGINAETNTAKVIEFQSLWNHATPRDVETAVVGCVTLVKAASPYPAWPQLGSVLRQRTVCIDSLLHGLPLRSFRY